MRGTAGHLEKAMGCTFSGSVAKPWAEMMYPKKAMEAAPNSHLECLMEEAMVIKDGEDGAHVL